MRLYPLEDAQPVELDERAGRDEEHPPVGGNVQEVEGLGGEPEGHGQHVGGAHLGTPLLKEVLLALQVAHAWKKREMKYRFTRKKNQHAVVPPTDVECGVQRHARDGGVQRQLLGHGGPRLPRQPGVQHLVPAVERRRHGEGAHAHDAQDGVAVEPPPAFAPLVVLVRSPGGRPQPEPVLQGLLGDLGHSAERAVAAAVEEERVAGDGGAQPGRGAGPHREGGVSLRGGGASVVGVT